MSLDYYHRLFHQAVCDLAKSSGSFSTKLLSVWTNYLFKIHWPELEAMLMEEDLQVFNDLKKRLHDDLHNELDKKRQELIEQTADAPRPLSEADASKYANAETVIRGMSGVRASNTIARVVELYEAISLTLEHQRKLRKEVEQK